MELLRLVKKDNPETAFIMITGLMDLSAAVDSLRTGACDFITKPFELMAMRRSVERALERRRLLMENRWHQEELERKVQQRTHALNEALHDVEDSYKIIFTRARKEKRSGQAVDLRRAEGLTRKEE